MKIYRAVFTKFFWYMIEARNEHEAAKKAKEAFFSEIRTKVADTSYDEIEIWEVKK